MAVDPVPFFVGGGTTGAPEHSPEVVRQFIYDSTSGAEGVSSPDAMRVLAMPTPSNKVRVMPGGGLMNNRYAGGAGQSYDGRVTSQTEVPITATGSTAARTDMVILRVLDPQYEGQAPADWNAFQFTRLAVVEGVSASAKTAADLNLPYPAIALARVTIPKSTATITAGMIADLRKVANPLEHTEVIARPTLVTDPAAGMLLTYTTTNGEWFPNAGGDQRIDVPAWATRMQIEAEWLAVLYGPENATGWGDYWVDYGPPGAAGSQQLENSTQRFRWDAPKGDYNRANWKAAQDVPVPANMRGKSGQQFIMKARRDGGTITCKMDHRSGVIFKVRFMQVATLSDS